MAKTPTKRVAQNYPPFSSGRPGHRAVIYHRVSTLDQDPTLARTALREAGARLGFDLVGEVEETASGAWNGRPGLLRVLAAAQRGELDAVLVWKLDRFGRSALDLLANLRTLESAGVRFLATSQGLDLRPGGDAMSRLLVTVLGAIAEFERDLIRDRTRLGLQRARAAGKRLGRPSSGLDASEIRRMRAEGLSWRAIGDQLGTTSTSARRAVGEA